MQRDQRSNCQHLLDHQKIKSSRKISTSVLLSMPKPLTMCITTNCGKLLKRWEYKSTLPVSWECCMQVKNQTVRTGHGTTDWSQIGKGVIQSCILSPHLFSLYAEYIMWNAGLDEAQAGIKIAGRNINNLRYADDTILMAEREEELESHLIKGKEEWKSWLKTRFRKLRSQYLVPLLHGK